MNRNLAVGVLVILAALACFQAWRVVASGGRSTPDLERQGETHAAPALRGTGTRGDAEGSGTRDGLREGAAAEGAPTGSAADGAGDAAASTAGGVSAPATEPELVAGKPVPPGWTDAPPAVRESAMRPPGEGRPGTRFGPGRTGPGPTGHWSRFPPPPPPRGTARLRVEVVDAGGVAVPGADLYLAPPAFLGREGVSFGDLRRLGPTDAAGRLLATSLPSGAAALAGNVDNRLNGPRGLDARSSVAVLLRSDAEVAVRLELPVDLGAYGAIEGRVVDTEGRPIVRAEVRTGYARTYADADGRFAFPRVPEGEQPLTVLRTGYRTERPTVEVPAGGRSEVEIVLGFAETGPLHLEGRVLGPAGETVPGAQIYLMVEGAGTLRSLRADGEGRYRIDALPERLAETPVRVQAGDFLRGYQPLTVELEEGIQDARLDIQLRVRLARLELHLTDAGSGEPITSMRATAEPLDDPDGRPKTFTGSSAEGVFDTMVPGGRYRLTVEAPDHETQSSEVEIHAGDAPEIVAVRLVAADASVQVTLRILVLSSPTGDPVGRCRIEVLDAEDMTPLAGFEGAGRDGWYSLPAPSGRRRLRVSADGFESVEVSLDLLATEPETARTVHLMPR